MGARSGMQVKALECSCMTTSKERRFDEDGFCVSRLEPWGHDPLLVLRSVARRWCCGFGLMYQSIDNVS